MRGAPAFIPAEPDDSKPLTDRQRLIEAFDRAAQCGMHVNVFSNDEPDAAAALRAWCDANVVILAEHAYDSAIWPTRLVAKVGRAVFTVLVEGKEAA